MHHSPAVAALCFVAALIGCGTFVIGLVTLTLVRFGWLAWWLIPAGVVLIVGGVALGRAAGGLDV